MRLGGKIAGAATALLISVAVLVGPLGAVPAGAKSLDDRMLQLINGARQDYGLRPLRLNSSLSRDAARHTERMIRAGRIFHSPNLPGALDQWSWGVWGENVGCAGNLQRLHNLFMQSPEHRENILKPRFRHIALGVDVSENRGVCGRQSVWATEIFYG